MLWYNIFFVHWSVPEAQLLPHIPRGLRLDLFKGNAYLSLVALHAVGPAPLLLLPLGSIFLSYHQLNVRTYVTADTGKGIVLLNTLVDHLLPSLGARMLGMPYRFTRDLDLKVHGGSIFLHIPGLDVEGKASDVAPSPTQNGSLESFLVDRFWVYAEAPCDVLYGVRITHAPWRLRPVRVADPLPSSAIGIDGAAEPTIAHLAEDVNVSLVETAVVKRE